MTIRTAHEINPVTPSGRLGTGRLVTPAERPALLSSLWVAVLLANLFRDVHEILRPGFVDELAHTGTVHGTAVGDRTLVASALVLAFIISVVVLARILPRRSNRRVNVVAAVLMTIGVLASWPKDPDDLVFGAFQLFGAAVVVAVCADWRDTLGSPADQRAPAPSPI